MLSDLLLTFLESDPTERHLSDLADHHHLDVHYLHHTLGEDDVLGYALVRVEDGLLKVPYTAVTLGDGWEHFDLDHAAVMPEPPTYAAAVHHYQVAMDALVDCLTIPTTPTNIIVMVEGHKVHRIISDQPVQAHVLDDFIPGDPPQVIRLNGHPYAVVNEEVPCTDG